MLYSASETGGQIVSSRAYPQLMQLSVIRLQRLTKSDLSHGRDNKLHVWQLNASNEAELENTLPVDNSAILPKPPWLLHALTVNTLNFCPFAMCRDGMPPPLLTRNALRDPSLLDPILIAVPNTVDSGAVCLRSSLEDQ